MSLNHQDIPNAAVPTPTTILNAVVKKLQPQSSQGDNALHRVYKLIYDPESWFPKTKHDSIEDRIVQ